MEFQNALIITYPYGTLIKKTLKKIIVKSKNIKSITDNKLLLIENKLGLGIIELATPYKINLNEFNKLRKKHLISEHDRLTWWPKYKILYVYNIIYWKSFKIPILLDYPSGPQIVVKTNNIIIKKIYVGTSGYYYKNIYPDNQKDLLNYYSNYLNAVEINYTFYKNPNKKFIKHLMMYDLKYSIKVNKTITHYKQLKNINKLWKSFYNIFKPLYNKIICFLFQFNSRFKYNNKNLNKLYKLEKLLDNKHRYAFEFHDIEWFNEKIYYLFKKNNWMIVILNVDNINGWIGNLKDGWNPDINKLKIISDSLYFRLHGSSGQYIGLYKSHVLNEIWNCIAKHKIKKAFVFFNNTDDGNAWINATKFYKYLNPLNS